MYGYNRMGAIAMVVTDGVTTHTFTYDVESGGDMRLLAEEITGLIEKTIEPQYDSGQDIEGRRKGLTIKPNGGSVEYEAEYGHDAKGRLNLIKGPGLPAYGVNYGFVSDSDMIGLAEYKDGSTVVASTTRVAETHRDLVDYVENKWGTTSVSKYDYENDNLARRTNVVNTGSAFGSGRLWLWEYNDRHELTMAHRRQGTNPASPGSSLNYFTFGFDPIGNRLSYYDDSSVEGAKAYVSNALNQYEATESPDEDFDHDEDGNLIEDGAAIYTWDGENRLIRVEPKDPDTKDYLLEFAYDYMGRRVRKTAYGWTGTDWDTTKCLDLLFVYDGWNLVEELDARSGFGLDAYVLRQYTWGLDLSGQSGNPSASGIHGAGGIGGLLAMADVDGSKDYLYFCDANGNVGQMVDLSDGSVDAAYEYYPFGGELVTSGLSIADVNPFRFSSKYLDTESRAYYYGSRYHMPKHGRWLNRDPIEEDGGYNLYRFCENSATNIVDPDGRLIIGLNGKRVAGDGGEPEIRYMGERIEREINQWRGDIYRKRRHLDTDYERFQYLEGGDGQSRHELRGMMKRYGDLFEPNVTREGGCECYLPEGFVLFGYSDGAMTIHREFRKGYAKTALRNGRVSYLGLIDMVRTTFKPPLAWVVNGSSSASRELKDADLVRKGKNFRQTTGWFLGWRGYLIPPLPEMNIRESHIDIIRDNTMMEVLIEEAVEAYKVHVKEMQKQCQLSK